MVSSSRLGDCDDDDFSFIGDENENDSDENNENYVETEPRKKKNKNGKRVRGKDIEWRVVKVFKDVAEFKESEIYKEIEDEFTEKRNVDWEYGHVYNYYCKFNRRVGFFLVI